MSLAGLHYTGFEWLADSALVVCEWLEYVGVSRWVHGRLVSKETSASVSVPAVLPWQQLCLPAS